MLKTISLKLKTKCFMKSLHIQFDWETLKDTKIADVYQAKVCGRFTAFDLDSDVDTLTNSLKEGLSTAGKVLRRQRKKI